MELSDEERQKLNYILACRKKNQNNRFVLSIISIPLLIVALLLPNLKPLCGLLVLVLIIVQLYSITKTAHVVCPRCNKPFGSNWPIALDVGGNNCQSCDLSLSDVYKDSA
ncbi:hypothetical protein J7384_16735 [Endozoicomonas sp. G2_1]|uniref:hypothetical protein n=1 Tax=Endozoicomonas sp. G2_1 TaxID=2821091 RepID=UPI001ADC6665|nr:hypothetical protein [Endozoicomonas sp. G2_1]MBO9492009.1 hypothetical protein [Endozoicomonas sp. G2_1]